MKKLNNLEVFKINQLNDVTGGAWKTNETSSMTGGQVQTDTYYILKKNNETGNDITNEPSHYDYNVG
ncbi:hypothetical protein [Fluviicola taffensis]|uniref:TonB-dependent receptor plug n=1 Tax=Fluviicola taffensis (strain DSM 16823 / NCIMB 13979 / RW262) TaxID=755732 RepID=F2IIX2_FLUTR|nr:hypothetical protein [Fluviicola taffensis]AEA42829.1 TonB-dependent receptor plug [Fluviicola taffensis DSM 16823]